MSKQDRDLFCKSSYYGYTDMIQALQVANCELPQCESIIIVHVACSFFWSDYIFTAEFCHLWAAALFVAYKYIVMQELSHADVVFTTTTGCSSIP